MTFRVEHHPETANPKNLPWGVFRAGPIIWWSEERYARACADALNNGMDLEAARKHVRDMPD